MRKMISIIIPVYNEKERLKNLYTVLTYLKKRKYLFEIIVVDDGSEIKSLRSLKKIKKDLGFKLLRYKENKGKGYALRYGILEAKGDYILFSDIDLSVSIDHLDKFIEKAKSYHVVIGSRNKKTSKIITPQSKTREFMGNIFTNLSKIVLGVKVSDFTCGFKCFQKEAAKNIFSIGTVKRWGFDSEIILIAERLGYKITELPVEWKHDSQTKVRFPQDIFKSLGELVKIKINDLRGIYSKQDFFTS